MNVSACPDEEQLRAYVLGKLPEDMAEQTERHIQVCQACEATAESLETQGDSLVEQIREPPPDDAYLAEPQCQVAVVKAKLLAGKAVPEEAQPRDLAPGQPADLGRLGEYQLLAKLGEGGMGVVYKARQTRLQKIVALKVLPRERVADPRAVTRFEREMAAVGQLANPNIVQAHDARDIQGTTVLVMEYVDGKDLARVVRRLGRLRISDACELVRQTALALQYAHEHGLVHRDIKPSNLMLTILPSPPGRGAWGEGAQGEGIVKILDLGLALLRTEQPGHGELSWSGEAIGTADYMAPEQASDAHSVDVRADIYSLGCTLYKLLTGSAPFSGPQYQTPAEKLVGHLKETPPPLRLLRTDVPAELAAVIERMMAKSPADRFATAAEVAAAIAPFTAGCDLAGVLAEAAATAEEAMPMERAPCGTDPIASSAVVDTDATGLAAKEESRERMPAPGAKSAEPRTRPRFGKPLKLRLAVGVAALFAIVLLSVLIIKLQTSEGTLIVKMDDPRAIVQVLNEKGEVLIERKGEKGSVTIGVAPGKGRLRLVKDGMQVFTRDFSLVSGGKETIEASLEQSQPSSQHWSPAVALFDAKKAEEQQAKEQQAACAKQLGVPAEITNSIGMKLALIPSGEFQMGSTKELIEEELKAHGDDQWYKERLPGEVPQHPVRITKPFYLGIYEVTQEEYQSVMGSNPSGFSARGPRKDQVAGQDTKRFPVECVTWDDAVEFCRKLSAMPVEKAAGRTYGLPSEAQWEYACRAGSTGRYSFSMGRNAIPNEYDENGLADYGWFKRNAGGMPHAVGGKRPSAWGLYDMQGNVWEWCQDTYQKNYYANSPVDDPGGPPSGSGRVYRGGGWDSPARHCRSAIRNDYELGDRNFGLGFRVALVSGEEGATPKPRPGPGRLDKDKQDVLDAKKAKSLQAACARQLGVPVEITNSIGMKLALIPSGDFQMGSTKEQIEAELRLHGQDLWTGRLPGELPQHRARISKPYRLGVTEVTQEEYQRVMGSNPSKFQGDPKRPVEQVPWDDAVEFCRRLSELPREKAARRRYGLPTEAQWEYACRAESTVVLQSAADPVARVQEERILDDYAWFDRNAGGTTHPVRQKRANAFGLSDMYGNVAEWCADWYQWDYYAKSPTDDPSGPPTGADRVVRGGCWSNYPWGCRLTARCYGAPGLRDPNVGFRVALVSATQEPRVGANAVGMGTYNLSGRGPVSAVYETPILSGTGRFTQHGGITGSGSNINLDDIGTHNLPGSVEVSAPYETLGLSGTGTLTQSGGTNSSGYLNLGVYVAGSGTYNLSGTDLSLSSSSCETPELSGTGAFMPGSGTDSISYLNLGFCAVSSGTYNLSEGGQVSTPYDALVWSGTGTFTQPGGLDRISVNLNLGDNAGSIGTCNLSGIDPLSAPCENVPWSGTGTFMQFMQPGGANASSRNINLGVDAKKELLAAFPDKLGVPVEVTITNSIGMKLALIPPGEFKMGSRKELIEAEFRLHAGNTWWSSRLAGEAPQHRVWITKWYRLGVTEVTQEQYQRVMGSNPSKFQGDPKRPVERVSWHDAVEFCRRLSELPEEKAAKRRYELPTEAEWEYACRAGSTTVLQSAADSFARLQEEMVLDEYAWTCTNSNRETHSVGQKRANAFGLSDMYGNVAEWCADWYQSDYYAKSPADDPRGPATGSDRVVRGGSWFSPPCGSRLTARNNFPPANKSHDIGFRVAQLPADK